MNELGNTPADKDYKPSEIVNNLAEGQIKAVQLLDGTYITEKLAKSMTKAEQRALEAYPNIKKRGVTIFQSSLRKCYQDGYEQAEKDTIERAIAWLKEHANEYIVDLTPTYPDAPANIIVGGMCWEHLKDYLQNE